MKINYVYKNPRVRKLIGAYDAVGYALFSKRPQSIAGTPKKICFIMLHQIGDVIMCLPTIDSIVKASPGAEYAIVAGKVPASIIQKNDWNIPVYTFDAAWQKVVKQMGSRSTKNLENKEAKGQFLSLMRKLKPDVVIVFHPDLEVNRLLGQTDIPYTIGFNNAGAGFRLTHPISIPQEGHQVIRNCSLGQTFTDAFATSFPDCNPPHLVVPKEAETSVAKIVRENNIPDNKIVIIHPVSSAKTKDWLPEYWAEVIDWLISKKFTPVIIGGPNDRLIAKTKEANEKIEKAANLCGKLSLIETAALSKLAKLAICVDSGPGHIAAAVGTPVVSIFSSVNRPERWAPYGEKGKVIILHKPVEDRNNFPYEMRDLPEGVEGNPYSDNIKPKDVITASEQLLK